MKYPVRITSAILSIVLLGSVIVFGSCNASSSGEADGTETATQNEPTSEGMSSETTAVQSMVEYFDETIAGDKLTMVDFYAEWCGPCKRMAPFVVEVKEEQSSVVNVLQIDAEANVDIAQRYNLEGYPTIIFFKKGQIVDRALGYMDKEQILSYVNRLK